MHSDDVPADSADLPSRRAFLFLLVDDFSRLMLHGMWMTEQNARAGQQVLRAAIQRRGLPEVLYTDNADTGIMPTPLAVRSQAGLKLSA